MSWISSTFNVLRDFGLLVKHINFRCGTVEKMLLEDQTSSYILISLQVGSVTNTFNVPGVEENCFFLKDMEGAKALRQRINECFEISALPSTTPEERKRLLTFVVVGHTAVHNCCLGLLHTLTDGSGLATSHISCRQLNKQHLWVDVHPPMEKACLHVGTYSAAGALLLAFGCQAKR